MLYDPRLGVSTQSYVIPTYAPQSVDMSDLAGYGQQRIADVSKRYADLLTQLNQQFRRSGWGNTTTVRTSARAGVERQQSEALARENEAIQAFLANQRMQRGQVQWGQQMDAARLGLQQQQMAMSYGQPQYLQQQRYGYGPQDQAYLAAGLANAQQARYDQQANPFQLGQRNRAYRYLNSY